MRDITWLISHTKPLLSAEISARSNTGQTMALLNQPIDFCV